MPVPFLNVIYFYRKRILSIPLSSPPDIITIPHCRQWALGRAILSAIIIVILLPYYRDHGYGIYHYTKTQAQSIGQCQVFGRVVEQEANFSGNVLQLSVYRPGTDGGPSTLFACCGNVLLFYDIIIVLFLSDRLRRTLKYCVAAHVHVVRFQFVVYK